MRSKDPAVMEEILKFAERFYVDNLRSPTKAEISEEIHIACGTVSKYLFAMRDNGMIEYDGYSIHTPLTRKHLPSQCTAAILGSISCGALQHENENIEGFISLPEVIFGKGEFYLLKANGDSMTEAGIDDGDWIVIKKQDHAKEGDIVVALADGMNTLKYFHCDNGYAVLRAANPDYEDIYLKDLSIQGIAVKIIKSL